MDTSSYGQGILVGGVLTLPTYDLIPNAIVVKQEQINIIGNSSPTIIIRGNVTVMTTGQFLGGGNRNFPGQ